MPFRFGTIHSFDKQTYTADVEIGGHISTYVTAIPVAFHCREDLVDVGTRCVVLFLDELNPNNAVVLALFSGRPADDPRFDPVHGHRHTGAVGDAPELE
jgi:hypothetical protein